MYLFELNVTKKNKQIVLENISSNLGLISDQIFWLQILQGQPRLIPVKIEGRWSCPICTRSFNRKWMVRRHLQSHTGEKNYSCTLCDYASIQYNSLRKHMENKHGIIMKLLMNRDE